MANITVLVFCARSQNSSLSVSVRRVYILFSSAWYKGGGKPCPKTRETAVLGRGTQKVSRTWPGSNSRHRCVSFTEWASRAPGTVTSAVTLACKLFIVDASKLINFLCTQSHEPSHQRIYFLIQSIPVEAVDEKLTCCAHSGKSIKSVLSPHCFQARLL